MTKDYLQILQAIRDIPAEELLRLWDEELKEFDNVGPTVEELLLYSKRYRFRNKPQNTTTFNTFNQKFTSGFFLS